MPAMHPVTALSGSRFGEGAQRSLAAKEPNMQRPEEGQVYSSTLKSTFGDADDIPYLTGSGRRIEHVFAG